MSTVTSVDALPETVISRLFLDTTDIQRCANIPIGNTYAYYSPQGQHKVVGLIFYTGDDPDFPVTRTFLKDERNFLPGHMVDLSSFMVGTQLLHFNCSVVVLANNLYYEIPVEVEIASLTAGFAAVRNFDVLQLFNEYSQEFEQYAFVQKTVNAVTTTFNKAVGLKVDPVGLNCIIRLMPYFDVLPTSGVVVQDNLSVSDSYNDYFTPSEPIVRSTELFLLLSSFIAASGLTVTAIDIPAGTTLVSPTLPIDVSVGPPAYLDITGFVDFTGQITITHNGLNSPFILNMIPSVPT